VLTLAYRHVDVFSRYACQGNGLVVVPGADGLPTMVQQQLTREMRQFETVFLSSVDLPSRTARLRVFTEDEELGFAGHPVLGAGALLHDLLASAAEESWTLRLGGRNITVRTRGRAGWVDTSMDQGPVQLGGIVTGELVDRYRRALYLEVKAVSTELPMPVVSTGMPYLIVPIKPEGLAAARIAGPDFEALLKESGARLVYLLDPGAPEGRTWDTPVGSRTLRRAAPPARPPVTSSSTVPTRPNRRYGSLRVASPAGRASSRSAKTPATATTGWEDR
jgi:PhzF family phenazine biosynthesis protein